jgi:hypothetical protein
MPTPSTSRGRTFSTCASSADANCFFICAVTGSSFSFFSFDFF